MFCTRKLTDDQTNPARWTLYSTRPTSEVCAGESQYQPGPHVAEGYFCSPLDFPQYLWPCSWMAKEVVRIALAHAQAASFRPSAALFALVDRTSPSGRVGVRSARAWSDSKGFRQGPRRRLFVRSRARAGVSVHHTNS